MEVFLQTVMRSSAKPAGLSSIPVYHPMGWCNNGALVSGLRVMLTANSNLWLNAKLPRAKRDKNQEVYDDIDRKTFLTCAVVQFSRSFLGNFPSKFVSGLCETAARIRPWLVVILLEFQRISQATILEENNFLRSMFHQPLLTAFSALPRDKRFQTFEIN